MRAFTYVITTDNGTAPNYDSPFTTLATGKPRIRRRAAPGDVVIAFTGRKLGPEEHSVRWGGVVRQRLTFEQYWDDPRFQRKKPTACRTPDNIYRPSARGLVQVSNPAHGDGDTRKDLNGEFVLILDPVWRFGAAGPTMPDKFGLGMACRRRRIDPASELSPQKWSTLKAWLDAHPPYGPTPQGHPASGRVRESEDRRNRARAAGRGALCGGGPRPPRRRQCED